MRLSGFVGWTLAACLAIAGVALVADSGRAQEAPAPGAPQAGVLVTGFAGGKPFVARHAKLRGDEELQIVMLSDVHSRGGDIMPGETRLCLLVRREWSGGRAGPIALLDKQDALVEFYSGDFKDGRMEPDFAGAFLIHNATNERIDDKSFRISKEPKERGMHTYSAIGGAVRVLESDFKKRLRLEFAAIFANGQVAGSLDLSGK